ncbi:MAG: family 20 glycosylhydrolase [bacterium]
MFKYFLTLILLTFVCLSVQVPHAMAEAATKNRPAFIPLPQTVQMDRGALALTAKGRIVAGDKKLTPLAAILSDEIFTLTGLRLTPADGKAVDGDILLQFDPALKGEEYSLDVKALAAVKACDYASVVSGTVTLLQALQSVNGAVTIPYMRVSDKPAYPYRGVLIDLARKYHTPGGIKQVIQLCRLYKIRYLHINLSDDQLFMFPSTKFPQVGKGNWEFARFEPASKPTIAPYTLDELKELEKFSQARGVHIVPEINLPGHSGRLVGDAPETFAFPGNGNTVNIASPKTLAAVATLLNEMMDVFQGTPYVHLGADEVGLGGLEKTAEYKEAQDKLGTIKSPHDLYCKFIVDLHGIVAKHGKKSIVWEEAWNAGGAYPLPKDTIVMAWTHGRNPADIVKSGYQVINATWTPLYIVRGDKRPMDFLFNWQIPMFGQGHLGNDTFTTLTETGPILGTQLCSWENSENIEIQSLRDRLALVGEKAWNPEAGGTLALFKARLAHTDQLLEKLVNPIAIQVQGAFVQDENTFTDPLVITLEPRVKGLTVKYTLDNSLPSDRWKIYAGPITADQTVHLRAGLFDAKGAQQGYLVGSWFNRKVVLKPNLATGKPVIVGPDPDRSGIRSAPVAVDGKADNVDSYWDGGPAPSWLQVDMEKVCPIDNVNVITYYDGGRYYQLNVEVSVDGKSWKKVLDFSKDTAPATAAGYAGNFPKADARYVRVNMLKNSANPSVHIVELIVNQAK